MRSISLQILTVFFTLLLTTSACSTNTNFDSDYSFEVSVGDPVDALIDREGDPTLKWDYLDQGEVFAQYYYQALNRSFLIDIETGYICQITHAKNAGSCFPCQKNEVSSKCP